MFSVGRDFTSANFLMLKCFFFRPCKAKASKSPFFSAPRYKLTDTGQGFHRLQPAPRIYAAMVGWGLALRRDVKTSTLTHRPKSVLRIATQRAILHKTQQELGMWIGSSVIHLGDTNVPNAVVFIGAMLVLLRRFLLPRLYQYSPHPRLSFNQNSPDKYTQVARILGPIVQTLKHIPKLAEVCIACAVVAPPLHPPGSDMTHAIVSFHRMRPPKSG